MGSRPTVDLNANYITSTATQMLLIGKPFAV